MDVIKKKKILVKENCNENCNFQISQKYESITKNIENLQKVIKLNHIKNNKNVNIEK